MSKPRLSSAASYGAKDITVLEGLEAVRKRPAMYIGSTGPKGLHHLIWEVLDNAVEWATRHGMYVILDLHAAPGAQVHHNIADAVFEGPIDGTAGVDICGQAVTVLKGELV